MNGKFYIILCKGPEIHNWTELNGLEYTESEANSELRHLKKVCDTGLQFRKKCVYNGPVQILSARRVAL